MIIDISLTHNDARLLGSLNSLNAGNDHAQILLLDGVKPAPGAALTNTLTVFVLDKPAGVIVDHALVLSSTGNALVLKSGTATWARIITAGGDWWLDCDVSKWTEMA